MCLHVVVGYVIYSGKLLDYIVIHELCHLIHHDHSPKFWREVERVMSDYKEHKEWLKVNGHKLAI